MRFNLVEERLINTGKQSIKYDGNNHSLVVKDLLVGHDGQAICGPVSMSIGPGECVLVVGRNGTGKTTLLHTLAGRLPPVGGMLNAFQKPLNSASVLWRKNASVLFDDEYFFPNLTVREHLQAVSLAHGLPGPRGAVEEALDTWGLAGRSSVFPTHLSSGQKRRLLLASAFLRPSKLMIMDEPEQRLDPDMRDYVVSRLEGQLQNGAAIVLATHDPIVAEGLNAECLQISADGRCDLVPRREGLAVLRGSHK